MITLTHQQLQQMILQIMSTKGQQSRVGSQGVIPLDLSVGVDSTGGSVEERKVGSKHTSQFLFTTALPSTSFILRLVP